MTVLSNEIYSPQSYIEMLTGHYYIFNMTNSVYEEIKNLQYWNGFEDLWNYPLNEIEHIIENKINVVLVDVSDVDNESGDWVSEYRWFEVPESCCNNFKR
jgi:hypothetical protein